MSLTITAVPTAQPATISVPVAPTELSVADFAAALQNAPMSGMPQLANPAALASEVFNHLRGFVERAHYYENMKLTPLGAADDGNVTLASADGGRFGEQPGGLARDNSALADPAAVGKGGGSTSQPVAGNTLSDLQNTLSDTQRKTLADLERVIEFCVAALKFSTETTLVGGGVSQGVRAVNTLLRPE